MSTVTSRTVLLHMSLVAAVASFCAPAPAFGKTPFTVKLTAPLSTKTSQKGQQVTAQVIAPAQFQNWFVVGRVDKCVSSGSFDKKSELRFSFQYLMKPDGSVQYPISAEVTSFTNSKGVKNTDEEGQVVEHHNQTAKAAILGGLAGAGIGALAGGAKGAAIGAAAGAAAGLLYASFGTKAPNITFDTGSQFELSVTTESQKSQ
jgi:hypothetical protein